MVDVAGRLASFSTRPPTPPRGRNDTVKELADDNSAYFHSIIQQAVGTPDDSPSSSGEYFGGSSEKVSKRVVFSPWTKYHKALSLSSKNALLDGHIKPLPPSRDCQSSKSILKPYVETVITPDTKEPLAVYHSNLPTMLRSVTQHLASSSRNSRLDAYMTLLGCLSAYEDVPDAEALAKRLLELTEFIRRDISARLEGTGGPDTQLATQALKLLATLLCTAEIGDSVSEDFAAFIMDRSISAVEDEEMPKILVSHYMHLLLKQNFSSKVMSNERVSRLLSALDKVANRINGNRVVGHRLMIYQRLLTQTKALMKLRAKDWMDHLVAGMLSTIKEIRSRAIAFGLEAGLALGTTSTVSQACVDVFNRKSPEGRKVVDFLTSRLYEMVASKEDGIHVPQIWSIAILFLRSRRRQVERWEHLKSWLMIIQRCFNSSDPQIKFQANIAWNRLVFAVSPDISTSPSMVKMLRQPIISQLDRETNDKHSRHAKQIARSSYCNLLYYAFRPVPTPAQLDQYWEEYVAQVIPNSFLASKSDLNHACEILTALFGGTGGRVWDEDRANAGGPVKPEDLPCLDPKWIRQRAALILTIFEKLLDSADWQFGAEEEPPILLAWRSFTAAVGEASSKEVKVSMESLVAVAQILTTIKRFWEKGLRQEEQAKDGDISETLEKVEFLVKEAVSKIGSMSFTEKRFVRTTQDSFQAAETPSTRSSRQKGPLSTAISHLLQMVISSVNSGSINLVYVKTAAIFIGIALQPATSRRSKLGVLRDLARLVPVDDQPQWPTTSALWDLIVEATIPAIAMPSSNDNHDDSPQYPGHEYREATKILEVGLHQQSSAQFDRWLNLSKAIIDTLRREVGDAGVVLVYTEPLAHAVLQADNQRPSCFLLNCASVLLETVSWPQSRQDMERAHRVLWGTSFASQKTQPFNPYNDLYPMVNTVLGATYRSLRVGTTAADAMTRFLSAVTSFISSCPLSLKVILLKRIQQGLRLWLEDANGLMAHLGSEPDLVKVYPETKKLWAAITAAIESLPKTDNTLLTSIGDLVLAGLTSRHQSILNQSIKMWNHTFGNADFLEYRDDLRSALAKLKSVTEMQLPNFPEDDVEVMSSPIHFIGSQDGGEELHGTPERALEKQDAVVKITTPRPFAEHLSQPSKISLRTSSRRSAEKPKPKTTPTARLRHDDSQIQFAAIASSSPLAQEADESQLLTERQKEVKERQGREAAVIFPDTRSSPRARSRNEDRRSLPKLVFSGNRSSHANLDSDDDVFPVLPSDNALMKDVFGSSPTPRSNKRVKLDLGSDFEPPSSPPSLPTTVAPVAIVDPQLGPSSTASEAAVGQNDSNKLEEQIRPLNQETHLPGTVPVVSSHDEEINTCEQPGTPKENANSMREAKLSDSDQYDRSDVLSFPVIDIFVDAPSEPAGGSPAAEGDVERSLTDAENPTPHSEQSLVAAEEISSNPHVMPEADTVLTPGRVVQQIATPAGLHKAQASGHDMSSMVDEVTGIMDSFFDLSTSFYSNEDDQIAAQLVSDLERASQQASPQKKEIIRADSQPKKRGRKRKSESANSRTISKKTKSSPSAQGVEVVVEKRNPSDINDCVIVDSRPAVSVVSSLLEVKQERSPSPSRDIRAVAKAQEAEVHPVRRSRSSAASAPMIQNLPPSSKKRKFATDKVKAEGNENFAIDTTASPGKMRRSARLSQASQDSSQIEAISSGEKYKNSAEVAYDRLRPDFGSRGRDRQGSSGSQKENMDQEQGGNRVSGQHDHEHGGNITPQEGSDEAPPRRLRKRARPSQSEEAKSPQDVGSAEGSLDEDERTVKRTAMDRGRRGKDQDDRMQQDDNPDGLHAARSSAQGFLGTVRQLLGQVERVEFGVEEERELMGLLFDSGRRLYESRRRRTMG